MTTPASDIPLSIDYTSRDFYSLREDLITLVKNRVNTNANKKWTGDDPTDFGVAMIEAFAYIGDLTNYYVDRIANETYLPTAVQRKNIINLANMYGYIPTGYRASLVQVKFESQDDGDITTITDAEGNGTTITYTADNSFAVGDYVTVIGMNPSGYNQTKVQVTESSTTAFSVAGTFTTAFVSGGTVTKNYFLPEGTQLTASVLCDDVIQDVFFTTTEDAIISAGTFDEDGNLLSKGTETIYCTQGENVSLRPENLATSAFDVAGETLGTSNQSPNQSFILSENQVVDGSVQVYVKKGDIYEPWTEVRHLSDYGPNDAVYQINMDADNYVYVVFGDGISGAIPNNLMTIKAQYVVGGGSVGNIGLNLINSIYRVPGFTADDVKELNNVMQVTNVSVAVGGSDPEDNRSIRFNAAQAITAINRAVSLSDYANLARYVGNVGKAKAYGEAPTSITLYVAPVRSPLDSDQFPGKNSSNSDITAEWSAIEADVIEFLTEKTQVGVSVTVSPPTYILPKVSIKFSASPQYTNDQAAKEIKETLLTKYAYAYLDFAQVITPEDIEYLMKGLASVRNAQVTYLYRNGDTPVRAPLIGKPAEIFSFIEGNLTVAPLSNDSSLKNLTSDNSGVVNPTFDSAFFSYNITGVDDSPTVLTFRTEQTASVAVTVNGTPVSTSTTGTVTDGKIYWTASVATPTGTTNIVAVVTAGDGITTSVYTAVISR